jgi:hypothetical protein
MKKSEIDGFSFDIASSEHSYYLDRKTILAYYFPISQVNLFATHRTDKKGLLARSIIVSPEPFDSEDKEVASTKVGDIVVLEKLDGLTIMTMVSERERGSDYIISRTWKRGRHAMKAIEKRKYLKGQGEFIYKAVLRYIDPPARYGTNILTWNYKDREKAFWALAPFGSYKSLLHNSTRLIDTERLRPPAESDFSLIDYVDINVGEERHNLLKSGDFEGKKCFVVESTPIKKDRKYGKRISWVDQQNFTPLTVEYWDKGGKLWKTLNTEWQNRFGFWFWKKAAVENVQTDDKTFITIEDVRVNLGLDDRDFTKSGLERQRHGFQRVQ